MIASIVSLVGHLRPRIGHWVPELRRVDGLSRGNIAEANSLGASSHQDGAIRQHGSIVLATLECHAFGRSPGRRATGARVQIDDLRLIGWLVVVCIVPASDVDDFAAIVRDAGRKLTFAGCTTYLIGCPTAILAEEFGRSLRSGHEHPSLRVEMQTRIVDQDRRRCRVDPGIVSQDLRRHVGR